MWVCVCKWGRNGLLVSQRDWPASWQVDLKSRRQSQGLVSHLSPLSFTSRNNFDTLSVCLTLLAVGDLWLARSLTRTPSVSPFFYSHGCRCSAWKYLHLCRLACKAISQSWDSLFIESAFLPEQEDTAIFLWPCSFSNFPASHLFLYFDRLMLVHLSVFDCSVWVLWLLIFFDCISFNLCSSWSLWDSTPVNLPVTALSSSKTKPVDWTVDCFMHLACRPKAHAAILESYSQADSYSMYFPPCGCSGYLADSNKLRFALWSSRVLKFPLCPWAPLVSVTHCLCTTKTQWCVAFWA